MASPLLARDHDLFRTIRRTAWLPCHGCERLFFDCRFFLLAEEGRWPSRLFYTSVVRRLSLRKAGTIALFDNGDFAANPHCSRASREHYQDTLATQK